MTITAPTPHTLQVACDDRLRPVVRKACALWSDVMSGHVSLVPWAQGKVINVSVSFGTMRHGERAHCSRVKSDLWVIYLDREAKWATSWWSRFIGNGDDAYATIVHEMGHIFKLPHAADPSWVMHPRYSGNGSMSRREKEHYRNYFLTEVDV